MDEKIIKSLDEAVEHMLDNKDMTKEQFVKLALSIKENQNYLKYIGFSRRYPKLNATYGFDINKEKNILEQIWEQKNKIEEVKQNGR